MDVALERTAAPVFDATPEALGRRVAARTVAAAGTAAGEIVGVTRDGGYDLAALGHRGRSPMAELLLGSVTERVLRLAACPVAIVRE